MTGRNSNGTFAKGNKAAVGHGRPARRTEASYLVSMTRAVTDEQWQQIVGKAVEQAIEGDSKAREWLGHYLLGATNPTRSRPTLAQAHAADPDSDIATMEAMAQHDKMMNGIMLGMTG